MTHTYTINESDLFKPDLYPEAIDEMMDLKRKSMQMNTPFKEQVVVSFLKDHSIASLWLQSDPEICKLMRSGSLKISHLESLFSCSRGNPQFLSGLETYIKGQLRENQ